MKLIRYKRSSLIYVLIVMQIFLLTSCNTKSYNSKHQVGKIGFIGFYLDMDYLKVKSIMDSLLNIDELHYFETTDVVGAKQKNLYYDFSGISPALCAKVNLRGSYIINERLTSIQLTLCTRSNTEKPVFSYNCGLIELEKLFESYREEYGKPTLLGQGEKYDWLSKKILNVYLPGPKGRWLLDKIYYWERGNYIIYFDFGYPESLANSGNPTKKSDVPGLHDSTSAPIIFYDFTQEYIDKLLEKASSKKEEEFK
ncbi:MAG: hypothetical protein ABSF81_11980 [Bacteroidales bacterium]